MYNEYNSMLRFLNDWNRIGQYVFVGLILGMPLRVIRGFQLLRREHNGQLNQNITGLMENSIYKKDDLKTIRNPY